MFDVNRFLDRAKAGAGNCTDYRLSKLVGVTTQAISGWRNGRTAPGGRAILSLCALSGDDPEHVAACIQAMRAANDDEARLWQRVANRLQKGAATVAEITAVALIVIATQLDPVHAAAALLATRVGVCILCLIALLRWCYRLSCLVSRTRAKKVESTLSDDGHILRFRPRIGNYPA